MPGLTKRMLTDLETGKEGVIEKDVLTMFVDVDNEDDDSSVAVSMASIDVDDNDREVVNLDDDTAIDVDADGDEANTPRDKKRLASVQGDAEAVDKWCCDKLDNPPASLQQRGADDARFELPSWAKVAAVARGGKGSRKAAIKDMCRIFDFANPHGPDDYQKAMDAWAKGGLTKVPLPKAFPAAKGQGDGRRALFANQLKTRMKLARDKETAKNAARRKKAEEKAQLAKEKQAEREENKKARGAKANEERDAKKAAREGSAKKKRAAKKS